ncbi:MAG: tetratricopeptide repeat protein [bacterium]|nr:tetratricopeptide repeat protein [bacterium]
MWSIVEKGWLSNLRMKPLSLLFLRNLVFKKSSCAKNDIPQNARERLSRILHKKEMVIEDQEQFILEWEEKYRHLEERLKHRCADDRLIEKAKGKLSSGDLDGAETLLKHLLDDYLAPKGTRLFSAISWLCKQFHCRNVAYSAPVKFFTQLKLRKKSSLSVRHYLKHMNRVPPKIVAESFYDLGLMKELKIDYQSALSSFKKALQYDRENTLYLSRIGEILSALGKYKEAIIYYDKALASDLKTYWDDLPDEVIAWNNSSSAYDSFGNYEKAIVYYEKGLASLLKAHGDEHPHIAVRLNNLGMAWESLGKYEKAVEYYEKNLAFILKAYGDEHPTIPASWENLGGAWEKLGRYEKAIESYEKSLMALENVFGKDHPDIKIVTNTLHNIKKQKNSMS